MGAVFPPSDVERFATRSSSGKHRATTMSTSHRIIVRDADPRDTADIVDFNRRLALESEEKLLDPEVVTAGVRRGFSHPELCRYLVAEIDGRVVGTTMITVELTDWRDGVLWWLQSVYVAPEFRGAGVFRALYRHIAERAHANKDVRGLRLYVHHTNQRAMRVYEAMGMAKADYEFYEHDWSDAVRRRVED
ncbi:MAG: GNAT family N-acetyltransferase [Candidatus Latescibacteria bacterium]|nr:GNAT family N-acetyltransferase [Candidatus Latescibacterota bacterium]